MSLQPLPAQTLSFLRQFSTPAINRAAVVAADASGIYVAGSTGFGGRAGIRKYDPQGNELWTTEFSVAAGTAQLVGAAADTSGVYIIGYFRTSLGAGPTGQFVRKYSTSGNELWTRQLELSPSLPLGGVATDSTGVYVAGSIFIRKYSSVGDELWTTMTGDLRLGGPGSLGVAADPTGVYVLGQGTKGTPPDATNYVSVRKFDLRGNPLWTRELGPPRASTPDLITAALPSGFFVADGNGASTYVRRYDDSGNQLWSHRVATAYGALYLGGITADATGVYVAGFTPLTSLVGQCRSGSGGDSFVRKFDSDGAELWTREFGTWDAAWASGVAVDETGIYVAGVAGDAQVGDALYLHNVFPTSVPDSTAFLAKFEKSPAAVSGSRPRIFPNCVVNAASYVGGGIAPGEIVSIFGSAMGPPDLAHGTISGEGVLPTSLAETRILFNGVPAPLVYVSDGQSSAIVPAAVKGQRSVDVQVEYQGALSDPVKVPVLESRPGIFTADSSGRGQGAILNEDGTRNSPSNPARTGSIITIYVTGAGEMAPGIADGQMVGNVLPNANLPVAAFFDITPSPVNEGAIEPKKGDVLYAGGVSGSLASLLQVNLRVPANANVTGDAVQFALVIGQQWQAFEVTFALR